jgi:hypothetical protein
MSNTPRHPRRMTNAYRFEARTTSDALTAVRTVTIRPAAQRSGAVLRLVWSLLRLKTSLHTASLHKSVDPTRSVYTASNLLLPTQTSSTAISSERLV